MVGFHEHFDFLGFFVDLERGDLGGSQGALNHDVEAGGIVEYIDVFVAQFADDAMDAGALDTDAGAHGVDAVVVGFNGDFGAFAGDAHDVADGDKAIIDFGNLGLEQALKEDGGGAWKDNHGVVVSHFDFQHHGAHGVTLAETVAGDLLGFRQHKLNLFFVKNQDFLIPGLIDLTHDDFADSLFVFLEYERLLIVLNFAHQILADGQDFAAAKVWHVDGLWQFLANLKVRLNFYCIAIGDLQILVFDFAIFNNGAVAEYFQVTFVNVDNDIEIVFGAITLWQRGTENFFENMHQRLAVYVLEFFKFRKGINQV